MKKITLTEKTGFATSLPFRILDDRKIEFYSNDFVDSVSNGERLKFNLPKGVYYYEGYLEKLPKPVFFKEITLPAKERVLPKKKYFIRYGKNPNKCTVNHLTGEIIFDIAFKDAPKYVLYDIYFHELGHRFYITESLADLYATKRLLDLGFNPSQIGRANILSLSARNMQRKEQKFETLKNLFEK